MSGLREIATFYDPEEAHVALGFLRANKFYAMLADGGMLMQSPMHRVALGGFRIVVPSCEQNLARDLLAVARQKPNRAAAACPACSAVDYRRVKSLWFPAVFLLLFGQIVPFAHNSNYLECRNCKTRVRRDYTGSMEPA